MKVLRLQPSTDTLNSLITACGKAGQLDRAFAIFDYMLDDGDAFKLPTLTTMNFLIREARRAGDHGRALSVLDSLQEINTNTIFRR
jgi:pentatricopeptide repeat protein